MGKTTLNGGRRRPEKGGDRAALKEKLGAEFGVAPQRDNQEALGVGHGGGEGNLLKSGGNSSPSSSRA